MVLISKIGKILCFLLGLIVSSNIFCSAQNTSAEDSSKAVNASLATSLPEDSIIMPSISEVQAGDSNQETRKSISASASISATETIQALSSSFNSVVQQEVEAHEDTVDSTSSDLSNITMGLLSAARKALNEGDYAVTEEAYRQTLQQPDIANSPSRVKKVKLQLARLLKRAKRIEDSIEIYQSLDFKQHKPEIYLEYIRLLHGAEQNAKALELCKHLLKENPDFFKAELTAAMITKSEGDYLASLLHFDRYLSMRPEDPVALLETGNLLEKMQQWRQARALYDRLISIEPDNQQALRNRGNALVHLGEYQLAVKDLTASGMQDIPWVERLLRYAKSQIDIAEAKADQKKRAQAKEDQLSKSVTDTAISTVNQDILIGNNDNDQSPTTANEISVAKVDNADISPTDNQQSITEPINSSQDSNLAPSEIDNSMLAKLDSIEFIEFSPEGMISNQTEQTNLIDLVDPEQAASEPHKEAIVNLNQNDLVTSESALIIEPKSNLVSDEQSDPPNFKSEPVNELPVVTKIARESQVTLPTKGMELILSRNFQEALPILRLEVKRFPRSLEISQSLRIALQSMSLFDEILQELDRMLIHYPKDYDLELTRSFYLLESGDVHAALKTTLRENDPYALYIQAAAMKKLGRVKDATILQERIKELDSRFSDFETGRFLWLVHLKDYLFAYPLGKKLIKANRPWLCFAMAVVARSLDYPVEAVLYLTQAVQDDPQNAKAYFELSQIMDQLGRPEDRDIFLQKALSIEPSNTEYKSYHQQIALKTP